MGLSISPATMSMRDNKRSSILSSEGSGSMEKLPVPGSRPQMTLPLNSVDTPPQSHPGTPMQSHPGTPMQRHPSSPMQSHPSSPMQSHPGTPMQSHPGTPMQSHPGTPNLSSPDQHIAHQYTQNYGNYQRVVTKEYGGGVLINDSAARESKIFE